MGSYLEFWQIPNTSVATTMSVTTKHHHSSFEHCADGIETFRVVQRKNELVRCPLVYFQRIVILEESILKSHFKKQSK